MSATGLPETDVDRVQRWCAERLPEDARHQMRIECEVAPRHLTIVERHAPWQADGSEWTSTPVARLRYLKAGGTWSLYWRDHNLRFHEYDQLAPSARVADLLAELDRDPTFIFWSLTRRCADGRRYPGHFAGI